MKITSKTAGFGIMAVAGLMLCTAAIADTMGGMGGMMERPVLDLAAMDADKDGKVSKDEIASWRAAQTAAVDANADGKLSVEELAARHVKAMTEAATTMAQRMVDRLDTDGDKLLSAAEMAARPMETGMFDRLDANKDGFLDQAELDAAKQAMMQHGQGRDGHRGGKRGDHGPANPGGN